MYMCICFYTHMYNERVWEWEGTGWSILGKAHEVITVVVSGENWVAGNLLFFNLNIKWVYCLFKKVLH